ncbi:hypothetical protein NMY22_g13028 [Coprinellus aureogranulatus]|nr:hypothetical protein NMY22_g13028 [Coprinellus aureogranulatus]
MDPTASNFALVPPSGHHPEPPILAESIVGIIINRVIAGIGDFPQSSVAFGTELDSSRANYLEEFPESLPPSLAPTGTGTMSAEKRANTTCNGIGPSAFPPEAETIPVSNLPSTHPPTYDDTRDSAVESDTLRRPGTRWLTLELPDVSQLSSRELRFDSDFFPVAWIPCVKDSDPVPLPMPFPVDAGQAPSSTSRSPLEPLGTFQRPRQPPSNQALASGISHLPKATELCSAFTQFQECHSDLRLLVKAIFCVADKLVGVKQQVVVVQEDWRDAGLHDEAHKLNRFLEFAERSTPRYSFPPKSNPTVDPVV